MAGQYSWRASGIDGAGFQNCVVVDPSGSGVILSLADVAGFHRSEDWGDTWRTSNTGLYNQTHLKIASARFSVTNSNIVLAGYGHRGTGGGIFKSVDRGQSWTIATNTPKFGGGNNVAPLPTTHPRSTGNLIDWDETNNLVYAGTFADGVMRASWNASTGSGGTSWTTIGLGPSGGNTYYCRSIARADADTLYVAVLVVNGGAVTTNSQVYRISSIRTSPSVTQLLNSPYRTEELLILGTKLYAVSADTGAGGGVWRADLSADNTWIPIGGGSVAAARKWCSIDGYVNGGDSKHHVWIGNENPGVSGASYGPSVMRCLDAAAGSPSWTSLTSTGTYVHDTVADSTGETWWFATAHPTLKLGRGSFVAAHITVADGRLWVAGRAGVWRTTDPTGTNPDWYPCPRHLAVTINRAVATDPDDPSFAYAANTDWDFFASDDHMSTVVENSPGPTIDMGTDVALRPSDGRVYLGTGNRDANTEGQVWSVAKPGTGSWTDEALPAGAGGFRPIGLAVGEPSGTTVIVAAVQNDATNQGGIWRKAGGTWTQAAATRIKQTTEASPISWPDQGSAALQTLFCYDRASGVLKSIDSGANWTRIWATSSDVEMTGYVAYHYDSDTLYINANSQLYRLDDASGVGVDAASPTNLGVSSAGPVAVTPDGTVFCCRKAAAGQPAEMLRSTNEGSSWVDLADDQYRAAAILPFDQLTVSGNGHIYLSLNGNGVIVGDPLSATSPAVTIEIGFGATWQTASPTWTDVTEWALEPVTWQSGRGRDSTALTAGTAKVILRNRDDRFTPENTSSTHYPNVKPLVPIRIRATHNSITYDCWRGFVREWQCDWSNPSDARVTLDCVDLFRVFGQHNIESQYAEKVMAHNPTYYWRCGNHPAAWSDSDLVDETANNYRGTGLGLAAASSLIAGDNDGALGFGSGDGTLAASQFNTDAWLSGTENFTIGFWWDGQDADMSGGASNFRKWFQQYSAASYVFVGIDTTTNYPRLEIKVGATTQSVVSSTAVSSSGGPTFIVATRSGSTLTLYVNGSSVATLSSAALTLTGSQMWWGNEQTASQQIKGAMDEIFVKRGGALTGPQVAALYAAGSGYAGDTPAQRVVRILDHVGWPNTGASTGTHRSIDQRGTGVPGNPHMRAWPAPANVLTLLQDCVTAEDGDCFIDGAGKVRFVDAHGRPTSLDDHVRASYPSGYWPLQETSGSTAADAHVWPRVNLDVVFGYATINGTYTGSPSLNQASLVDYDPTFKSVDFNGTSQYVTVADPASGQCDFTTAFSMGALVRPDTFTTERPIIAKSNSSGRDWWLIVDTSGNARCGLRTSGGTTYEVTSSAPLTAGQTHAVMGWYDDAANLIYVAVNGTVTSAAVAGSVSARTSTAPVEIGRRHDGTANRYFDGRLSHVWCSAYAAPAGSRAAAGWDRLTHVGQSFDDQSATMRYIDAQLAYEEQRIANEVTASYSGENDGTCVVSDSTSVTAYGTRPVSISPNLTEQYGVGWWGWLWMPVWRELTRRKQPKMRCIELRLDGDLAPATLWPIILGLDLSDRVGVTRHTYSGHTMRSAGYIDRIEHAMSFNAWTTTLQLSS